MGDSVKPSVEAYAGSAYPESPRAIIWEENRYEVQEILDRRREPDGVGFFVRCSPDRALFDLFYNLENDEWQIRPKGFALSEENINQTTFLKEHECQKIIFPRP